MMGLAGRRASDRTLILLLATAIGLILAIALFLRASDRLDRERERVHQYGGTTWIGDACYVDHEGTLWCTTSG